jgi:hypothetical protein
LGRLKSSIYARMEDMSFRSGAAVSAGVLAAAGVAITLAVALGSHSGAAPSASRPAAVAHSTPPPSAMLPTAAPAASLMPARGHRAAAPVSAVTTPQVLASSLPIPRFLHRIHMGRFFRVFPNLGGPGSLSRAGAPEWRRDGRLDRDGGGLFGWRLGRLRL